jgi:DNA-binding beta-propeller fold protein YncE
MKFRIILLLTIVCIAVLSCKNKEINAELKIIDLSSFGSVNMIKEIDGKIYVLNSTGSSVYKFDGSSLSLFRDLEIRGRDFLLDFDIEGDKVYYSNTYDEVFVSSGSVIEDTIKVFNPDRIAIIDSLLYVTSRMPEDGDIYLKLIDIESGIEINRIRLNDTPESEMKFAQVAMAEDSVSLWLMNPFRSKLEKYNGDLNIISAFDLPCDYQYGNFDVHDEEIKIISSKDNYISILNINLKDGKDELKPVFNSADIDIMTSCVSGKKTVIYDYISQSIIIL